MRNLLLACILFAPLIHAQLLPEAVRTFPQDTKSLEYDNLASLRRLPSYQSLRAQYSGDDLNHIQQSLLALGISESQLDEVITGSGPGGFFGLLTAEFDIADIEGAATDNGFSTMHLADGSLICSAANLCFLFHGPDRLCAFGSLQELQLLRQVRQGAAPSLGSNKALMGLINGLDSHASVFGVAPGTELGSWVGGVIPERLAANAHLNQLLSMVESFGYSVLFDQGAHISLNVLCTSETTSGMLKNFANAANVIQRAASTVGGPTLQFQNLAADSVGRLAKLRLDAPISPVPK